MELHLRRRRVHTQYNCEYNYVYKPTLGSSGAPAATTSAASGAAVTVEWNVVGIVGQQPADNGIEAIAFKSADCTTGVSEVFVGIQESAMVHLLSLPDADGLSGTGCGGAATLTTPVAPTPTTPGTGAAPVPASAGRPSTWAAALVAVAALVLLL